MNDQQKPGFWDGFGPNSKITTLIVLGLMGLGGFIFYPAFSDDTPAVDDFGTPLTDPYAWPEKLARATDFIAQDAERVSQEVDQITAGSCEDFAAGLGYINYDLADPEGSITARLNNTLRNARETDPDQFVAAQTNRIKSNRAEVVATLGQIKAKIDMKIDQCQGA